MTRPDRRIGRRAVLRGAGTLLALPWLERLALARPAARTPKLLWIYVPNGIHPEDWKPAEVGPLPEVLPPTLAPLDAHRDTLRVVSGLVHDKGRANGDGPGDHARAAATWLTGVQPLKAKGAVRVGPSADQVAAEAFRGATRYGSLSVGVEGARNSGQCDSGYACAYSSNVSWRSATLPAGKESDPLRLFDRLCEGGWDGESEAAREERYATRRSVLDHVRGEAKRLARDLGTDDRARLDQYFEGVRGLERRLAFLRDEVAPPFERPDASPKEYELRLGLLRDLVVWALATDQTRVATFMFANEGSNRSYRNLGIDEGHHTLSHHRDEASMVDRIREINRYHTSQLAGVLDALRAVEVEGRTLLDDATVVYGSSLCDGNRHDHHDLPTLVLGGGAGRLGPARHERAPKGTPMMNLHLGLLEAAGVAVDALGDSTGVLRP